MILQKPNTPVITFVTIAQSPYVVRIVYQGTYCLELNLMSDGLVSVRDGAYSRFDRVVAVSEYLPTGGLKVSYTRFIEIKSS